MLIEVEEHIYSWRSLCHIQISLKQITRITKIQSHNLQRVHIVLYKKKNLVCMSESAKYSTTPPKIQSMCVCNACVCVRVLWSLGIWPALWHAHLFRLLPCITTNKVKIYELARPALPDRKYSSAVLSDHVIRQEATPVVLLQCIFHCISEFVEFFLAVFPSKQNIINEAMVIFGLARWWVKNGFFKSSHGY